MNLFLSNGQLYSFFDLSGTDAPRAYLKVFYGAPNDGFYLLQIGVECPFRFVVGMADIVADLPPFPADFTYFSHSYLLFPGVFKP